MIYVTGPALAIVLVVGYFGIHTIIGKIANVFGEKKDKEEET